jgi:signal peptidase I
MRFAKNFFINVVIYIAIVAVLVFGLPRFLSSTLQTPYPMAAITSGSMWPALKEGDLVFIQGNITKEELTAGDIVVYRNQGNNTLTIHRIVKLGEETFVTKGDANFSEDAPARYEDLVGRTLTFFGRSVHVPYLGSITVFASNLRK